MDSLQGRPRQMTPKAPPRNALRTFQEGERSSNPGFAGRGTFVEPWQFAHVCHALRHSPRRERSPNPVLFAEKLSLQRGKDARGRGSRRHSLEKLVPEPYVVEPWVVAWVVDQ